MDVVRVRLYCPPREVTAGGTLVDLVLDVLEQEGAAVVAVLADGSQAPAADATGDHPAGGRLQVVEWLDTTTRHDAIWGRLQPLVRGAVVTREHVTALAWNPAFDGGGLAGTVDTIMDTDLVTVDVNDPLSQVVDMMLARGLRFVPVLEEGQLTGVITNTDLVERAGLAARLQLHSAGAPLEPATWRAESARDAMTSDPIAVLSGTPVDAAARLMLRRRVKRLPVLGRGRVVGVITRSALLSHATHAPYPVADALTWTGGARDIADLAVGPIPAVSADAHLDAIVDAVTATRLHEAVVVDDDQMVLGLISDSDLLRQVGGRTQGLVDRLMHRRAALPPSVVRARDLMSEPDLVVAAETDVAEALRLMIARRVKVLPIVDRDGRLTGVVDRADALRAVYGERQHGTAG